MRLHCHRSVIYIVTICLFMGNVTHIRSPRYVLQCSILCCYVVQPKWSSISTWRKWWPNTSLDKRQSENMTILYKWSVFSPSSYSIPLFWLSVSNLLTCCLTFDIKDPTTTRQINYDNSGFAVSYNPCMFSDSPAFQIKHPITNEFPYCGGLEWMPGLQWFPLHDVYWFQLTLQHHLLIGTFISLVRE